MLTLQEAGYSGQSVPDEKVLAFATQDGRAILTINRKHFIHFHRASSCHAGIIVCSFDPCFAKQAQRIHEAVEPYGKSLNEQLLRINRPKIM